MEPIYIIIVLAVFVLFVFRKKFQNKFSGPALSDGEQVALRDVMEIYNLQEHDLDTVKSKEK